MEGDTYKTVWKIPRIIGSRELEKSWSDTVAKIISGWRDIFLETKEVLMSLLCEMVPEKLHWVVRNW